MPMSSTLDDGNRFQISPGSGCSGLSVRNPLRHRNVAAPRPNPINEVFSWKDGQHVRLFVRLDNVPESKCSFRG